MFKRSAFLVLFAVSTALACGPPGTTLGGFCPIDANDPLVQQMAQFAVSTYASKTNSVNEGTIEVRHAWSQVDTFYTYRYMYTGRMSPGSGSFNQFH